MRPWITPWPRPNSWRSGWGVEVGSVRRVTETSGDFPQETRLERAVAFDSGGASVPVSPGDFMVHVSVSIVFDIES